MAASTNPADRDALPFTAFRFLVEVQVENVSDRVCAATFSEVDGLEMTIEPKTIREGGWNVGPIHLMGPVSYGQLTLKRGMTANFDLWKWFERVATEGSRGVRVPMHVTIWSSDGGTEQAQFVLEGCLPVKMKAPALNAKEGLLAIEEMQVVYETLTLKQAASSPAPGA